jgi:hypothetical protein
VAYADAEADKEAREDALKERADEHRRHNSAGGYWVGGADLDLEDGMSEASDL